MIGAVASGVSALVFGVVAGGLFGLALAEPVLWRMVRKRRDGRASLESILRVGAWATIATFALGMVLSVGAVYLVGAMSDDGARVTAVLLSMLVVSLAVQGRRASLMSFIRSGFRRERAERWYRRHEPGRKERSKGIGTSEVRGICAAPVVPATVESLCGGASGTDESPSATGPAPVDSFKE